MKIPGLFGWDKRLFKKSTTSLSDFKRANFKDFVRFEKSLKMAFLVCGVQQSNKFSCQMPEKILPKRSKTE